MFNPVCHESTLARRAPPGRPTTNALLSFGYVLVGAELQALLDGIGYYPYLGFYHRPEYGRPSLALDLLEEFRAPLVDRFSAKLLNLGVLSAEDFVSSPQGGIYLGQEGKRRYFAAYEAELEESFALGGGDENREAAGEGGGAAVGGDREADGVELSGGGPGGAGETTFRELFRRQAERLARAIQGEEPYRAFRYPC